MPERGRLSLPHVIAEASLHVAPVAAAARGLAEIQPRSQKTSIRSDRRRLRLRGLLRVWEPRAEDRSDHRRSRVPLLVPPVPELDERVEPAEWAASEEPMAARVEHHGQGHLVQRKERRSATHKRPSSLHLNSSCTSVDHLLARQERRNPNVGNISHRVNA